MLVTIKVEIVVTCDDDGADPSGTFTHSDYMTEVQTVEGIAGLAEVVSQQAVNYVRRSADLFGLESGKA